MMGDEVTQKAREKLPFSWRHVLKDLNAAIGRDLGPEIPNESKERRILREKLFELSFMIYSVKNREYWNTAFPKLLLEIVNLLGIELPLAPWWSRELEAYAKDLQSYGKATELLAPSKPEITSPGLSQRE
jgi:hypothetical protein